jgi:hypothetical protein
VFWASFVECFSLKILVLYSFEVLLQFWGAAGFGCGCFEA